MRSLKVKVVGDSNVGKTTLLSRIYCENSSTEEENLLVCASIPPVLDSYLINKVIDNDNYIVTFWDTCTMRSSDEFDLSKVRPLEYKDTDVFLICFDISCPKSFQNISTFWVPQLKHYMPGTPVVVVGNKMDLRPNGTPLLLSPSKGAELANRLETVYCESSALTGQGVKETIDTALHKAAQKRRSERGRRRFKLFQNHKTPAKLLYSGLEPPSLPQPGPDEVRISVLPSTYPSDMKKLLSSENCSDVTLDFSSCATFKAHKVILCMGTTLFKDLLVQDGCPIKDLEIYQLDPSLPAVNEKNKTQFLRLDSSCDFQEAFNCVMDFLYTYEFKLNLQSDESLVTNVLRIAQLLHVPDLVECCENILHKEDYLNNSICDISKEKKNMIAMDLFVNQPLLSDVTFIVEGTRIFGHKAVLMARCDVLAAMLGGGFRESNTNKVHIEDTSASTFAAMLEYLYTDLLPTSHADTRLLVLSDRFCLPRLRSLCELAISKKLTTKMKKKMHLSHETCGDVIEALLIAQAHNATQLYKWCVFIIKTNFPDFEFHQDLALLKPQDIEDITDQRWPPQSYLQQLEAYMKKINGE